MKIHKRKKYSRMHGRKMGTAGTGARKNKRKSGHKGGKGMSGSGKRADHKKTLINKKYGNSYFGKKGFTSIGSKRDKRKRINIGDIQNKYKPGEVDLSGYKILGSGELKNKFTIKAQEASASAIEKVKKSGGEIILPKKVEKKVVVKKPKEYKVKVKVK
jgi:large subunit ribosomal protein L15